MSRYIDADNLSKVKYHNLPYTHIVPNGENVESYERGWNDAIDAIIENEPTADVRENVHGEWISYCYQNLKCSKCGYVIADSDVSEYHYCPNCGAEMSQECNT